MWCLCVDREGEVFPLKGPRYVGSHVYGPCPVPTRVELVTVEVWCRTDG